MIKLGIISTFPPEKCGIAIYTENLTKELIRFKDIEIIKIGTEESDADYSLNFSSYSLKSRLKKIIEKESLDIIHIEHNYPHFSRFLNLNLISCLSLKIPFVITLHEVQYPRKLSGAENLRLQILKFIERQLVRKSTGIIVHTPNQKNFLGKKYRTKNIECIYHGLNLLEEKKKIGRNILFFGIMTPAKGVEYLIKAMDHLEGFRLFLVGDTPKGMESYKSRLNQLIKKSSSDITSDFRWISEQDKWSYFSKADIVVLPYTWAPYQSGVLHNALSCGLPVVVTKVGALSEIVDIFKLGEIIPPENPKAIADAVEKVFRHYAEYKKGIKRYREEANWKNVAEKHVEQYKKLAAGKR